MSRVDTDSSPQISDLLATQQLSQRDVGLRVPINFVTLPGVSLTSACFSDDRFEDGPAEDCFYNLVSIGYRRFVIDLYWDTSRLSWSLCPVELSSGGAVPAASSRNAITALSTSSASTSAPPTLTAATLASSVLALKERVSVSSLAEPVTSAVALHQRQLDSSASTLSGISLTSPSSSSEATMSFVMSSSTASGNSNVATLIPLANSGGTRFQIGPYTCDSSLGLTNITSVLTDHLKATENSLNATVKYLIFNLHSAATFEDPTGTSPTPGGTFLPDTGNYVSDLLNGSLSSYIYTPVALATQRADLNSSWYTVPYNYRPLDQYLDLQTSDTGDLYTTNGWPSESFMELEHGLRLLAGFGTIDPQMADYNFTADADTIFPSGYLSNNVDATFSSTGSLTAGCIFQSNDTSIVPVNSSWAVSSSVGTAETDIGILLSEAGNLTSCGVSPILNLTLGLTADNETTSYIDYIRHDIWSWAYNEPRDIDDTTENSMHCAVLNLSNSGRWEVADCSDNHYGACRIQELPYNWTITDQRGRYDTMSGACQDNEFSVPRTALENAYLEREIQGWLATVDDDDGSKLFWVDLNDLDITGCWVDGVNSTCPYAPISVSPTRKVLVPTIAAVIVFAITIGIIFIKCAGNRQSARRRRRGGDGGWDYEGVPS